MSFRGRIAAPEGNVQPVPAKRSIFLYAALAVCFAISWSYQALYLTEFVRTRPTDIPFFAIAANTDKVSGVSTEASHFGLQVGDELLAVNGQPYTGTAILGELRRNARVNVPVILTIRPKSTAAEETLVLPVRSNRIRLWNLASGLLLQVFLPVFCLLLGFWVAFLRPRDPMAWLLLILMMSFPHLLEGLLPGWGWGFQWGAVIYHTTMQATFPVVFFLFGRYFPEPFPEGSRSDRIWKAMQWSLVLLFIVFACGGIVVSVVEVSNYRAAAALSRYLQPPAVANLLRYDLRLFIIGSFFAALWIKLRLSRSPDARRRLLLLLWGAIAAFGPSLIAVVLGRMRGEALAQAFPLWLVVLLLLPLPIFPVTLAYVIGVQRAMGMGVALRQGLQYTLARGGVRMLQVAAVGVVIVAALTMATNGHNRTEKIIVIALGITAYFTIRSAGDRLGTWVDRRFFREAYNSEQMLTDLSDQVRSMVETKSLLETVAARISETLHVPQVAVLLDGGEWYRPALATGYESFPAVSFSRQGGISRVLAREKEPAHVFLHDRDSWLFRGGEVSDEERRMLSRLHSELLLPLAAQGDMLGFISLGPKLSEEPYTGSDIRLLKSVAAQTGLALENANLMQTVASEIAQRERLNREVEIAREVQERLFPQRELAIPGLDYSGHCRLALAGVGGDYYDFLSLPDGRLGVAIGDVSGKGIAAALMMASLQAFLRSEAARSPAHLAEAAANVSRLLYDSSSSNRYASLFYGQYEPAGGEFNYVNAGHNPPLVFRATDSYQTVIRLDVGGTVVGLLENYHYEQGSVTLRPGDILVAFTDGISEAMNRAEEEWGEERLIDIVRGCGSLSAQEILESIFAAVDQFVAGAAQHDDMTLVVLRPREIADGRGPGLSMQEKVR